MGRSFCVWGKKGEYERFFDADLYHRASCAFRLYRVAVKAAEKRQGCEWRGTMLLLRVQLIDYHDRYMRQGEIPSYAYENFVEMYEAYHDLGGNGMVTKMYEEISELNLKKKGEGK